MPPVVPFQAFAVQVAPLSRVTLVYSFRTSTGPWPLRRLCCRCGSGIPSGDRSHAVARDAVRLPLSCPDTSV